MPDENILVIAVDGLRASALGAYGNTTYPTPGLDQFAADSLLFDWCYVDTVELTAIYRSLWEGPGQLMPFLAGRGYSTTLVTDEPEIALYPGAAAFDDCVKLPEAAANRADDISQTTLARLFAAAIEQVEVSVPGPRLLWVHSRGMHGPWDAPLELQEDLLAREEGDPPPADEVQPPHLVGEEARDPDAIFRWACAYAAQVMALDACLEGLCAAIDAKRNEKWLVVLCGLRGLPLGEHGQIGGIDDRLYSEQLHVPMMWRFPDARHKLSRSGSLTLLADLPAIIRDAAEDVPHIPEHNAACAASASGARAIRTTDWSLRCDAPSEDSSQEPRYELFVRPDDRWEANDIVGLCPDVAEGLLARLAEIAAT
jgi:hypothetical protein